MPTCKKNPAEGKQLEGTQKLLKMLQRTKKSILTFHLVFDIWIFIISVDLTSPYFIAIDQQE
jgi:hypothetical protein